MNREWVLEFLQQHQPMPSETETLDGLLDDYEDVLDYVDEHPDRELVQLLLGSFGEGKSAGLYARASRIVFSQLPYDEIAPCVLDSLRSNHPGVRYWTAYGAVDCLDHSTIEKLIDQVPGLRKTLGEICWEYADEEDEEEEAEQAQLFGGIDYHRWSRDTEARSKVELRRLSGALIVVDHIPVYLRDIYTLGKGELAIPMEVIEGDEVLIADDPGCQEDNKSLVVYRKRHAVLKIANVIAYEICNESTWWDYPVCLDSISLRRGAITITDDSGTPAFRATVSEPNVSVLVSDKPAGELYIFNEGSGQHLTSCRDAAREEASDLGLEVDWTSLWQSLL